MAVARKDPYKSSKFRVEWAGIQHAGFQKVSGLNRTSEEITYREGPDEMTFRKQPGLTTYDDITLERGIMPTGNTELWDWLSLVDEFGVEGSPVEPEYKKDIAIVLLDKDGSEVRKWEVYRTWISGYSLGDFDATANDVLIKTITLKNEGFKEVIP